MLDLSHLNPQQKLAVETTEGPVLVLAGAGSGKTSVLTNRIAYIIDAGLAGPENILAVTFTNKAAGEMKERVEKLLKENMNQGNFFLPWMGTFHSIGVKILKKHGERIGIDRNFTIYDSSDQLSVVKEVMGELNMSIKEINPRAIHSHISSAKNELVSSEDYKKYANGYFQEKVALVYPLYQKKLKESNAVDFDDLLMLQVELFEKDNELLKQYQSNFKYIMVDEYQDTNHAQYKLITMLAEKNRNICAVGDDDQSIYAFRGATIRNILNFEKEYSDTEIIKLEQNYRSTKKILEASYCVIQKNKARKDKKLWTDNSDGEQVTIYEAEDEIDEAQWIIDSIKQSEKEVELNDMAILYRTNAQSRSLEEAFLKNGVPYRIIGAVRFYDRKEIKDILAYLRSIYNPKDTQSIERIINTPRRGIGPKAIQDLKHAAKSFNFTVGDTLINNNQILDNNKVKEFGILLADLQEKSSKLGIIDLINYVLERTKYVAMLDDGTSEGESRIENIKELITVAAKFDEAEPVLALEQFLDEVSLLEGYATNNELLDAVTLMTIHAAKGLEFKHVYVVGMEENLFPHTNSMFNESELEEERRLAYVAITRAKEKLALLHAKSRKYFGSIHENPVSRFVEDIDSSLVNYIKAVRNDAWSDSNDYVSNEYEYNKIEVGIGDKVKHEYFGIGTVKYMDSDFIEVDFGPSYGTKELMLEYARLTKV